MSQRFAAVFACAGFLLASANVGVTPADASPHADDDMAGVA